MADCLPKTQQLMTSVLGHVLVHPGTLETLLTTHSSTFRTNACYDNFTQLLLHDVQRLRDLQIV